MHPNSFREDLRRFDPRLDFQWNGRRQRWQVTGKDLKGIEYVIHEVPLGQIDQIGPQIIQALYNVSPTKQGGADAVNRMLDKQEDDIELAQDRKLSDDIDAVGGEAFDLFQRRMGRRISNAGIPDEVIENDRRRFAEDLPHPLKPLVSGL